MTVKAFKAWVADTNNDGAHNLSDVKAGDTVFVKTKRRFIDDTANSVSAAKVLDANGSGTAFHKADQDSRDGRCDHS